MYIVLSVPGQYLVWLDVLHPNIFDNPAQLLSKISCSAQLGSNLLCTSGKAGGIQQIDMYI